MKKLFTSSFLLLLTLTSTEVLAKNKIQLLMDQKSSQTPYEILSTFHEQADGVAVKLEDLNIINLDDGTKKTNFTNCATAGLNDSLPREAEFDIFVKTKKIPGTPANGPLFPGTPDTYILQSSLATVSKYLNSEYEAQILLDNTEWKQFENSSTTFDTTASSAIMSYANHSEIKKHGDLISYYYSTIYFSEDGARHETLRTYGYCWNE